MKVYNYLLGLIVLFAVGSCEESTEPELPPILFSISSPTTSQTFAYGDTVVIEGSIRCDLQMHGYEIDIIHPNQPDSVLFNSHAHIDGNIYPIYKIWVNNQKTEEALIVRFRILRNHETGEEVVKEMPIFCGGK